MTAKNNLGWRGPLAAAMCLPAIAGAVVLAFALLPQGDLGRMLLGANGSMLRGITTVALAGMAIALAGWWLVRRRGRRLAGFCLALAAGVGALGLGNAAEWVSGMDRRAVTFQSDGVEVRGTLMLPEGQGPFPAVVVVHGSARLGRDFYGVWARPLVRAGIAVLVYDKRGTGASGGVVPASNNTATYLQQLGKDAAQAVDALAGVPEINPTRIGLLGLSQGGWTVPVAAALRPAVWRIALLSGPVASVNEEQAFSAVAEGSNGAPEDDRAAIARGDAAARGAPPGGFDPLPYLSGLRSQGLWLFGGRDRHIPVVLSIERLRSLAGSGRPVRFGVYPQADHLLLDRSGFPPALDAALAPRLADWFTGRDE